MLVFREVGNVVGVGDRPVSDDSKHALAMVVALASVCGGTWWVAGVGVSLIVFGILLGTAVIYARTRGQAEASDER